MKKYFCTIILAICSAAVVTCCGEDDVINESDMGSDSSSSEVVEPLTENVRPTLTEGKMWIVDCPAVDGDDADDFRDTTVVSGRVSHDGYDAMYLRKYQNGQVGDIRDIYREANGSVYRYIEMTVGGIGDEPMETRKFWGTVHDVNANCGDVFGPEESIGACVIVSKGTIKLQGKMRRAVKVLCNYPRGKYQYDIWVEGIGALFCGEPVYAVALPSFNGRYNRLRECYENGVKIYDCSEFTPELYVETESMTIPAEWPEVDL